MFHLQSMISSALLNWICPPALLVLVVGLVGPARGQVCFDVGPPSPLGPTAVAVAGADLDGDGDVDFAVVDINAHTVSVLSNLGNGTFAAHVPYAVGGNPTSVTCADLDGDGDVDLAVSNRFSNSVSVLLNLGNGTFSPHVEYGVGPAPNSIESADLDGDGDVDLVTTNGNANTVSLLFNQGNGTFALHVPLIVGSNPADVAAADFDGDGDVDLIVINGDWPNGTLSLLLNLGGGTSWSHVQFAGVDVARAIRAADLDGDGDVDLVVTTSHVSFPSPAGTGSNSAWVFLNQGTGTFGPGVAYSSASTGDGPGEATIADLDGDGQVDLAFPTDFTGKVRVHRNLGNGTFARAVSFNVPIFLTGMTSADVDGDGDVDLVTIAYSPPAFRVLRNCRMTGIPVCPADGSGTSCPCGNDNPAGTAAGCLNSFALGGTLRGSGSASLSNDQLVLTGTGMPNSFGLYFQGTNLVNGGAGVVFGDGLRCVGGTIHRLGIELNANSASSYPGPADVAVSVRGSVMVPGVRDYQVWYRDPAAFCTTATFNLTNALSVTWLP